jgi:hypothetical protein
MASAYENLGNFEIADEGQVPSTAPLFVSLYIILVSFFVVLTKDLDLSSNQSGEAFRSVKQKFGKPEDQLQSYTQLVKPKFNEFVLELEKIFLTNAIIETTINGDRTSIISDKEFYFYADETNFKPQNTELIAKLQELLSKWNRRETLQITYKIGGTNFEQDKARLQTLSALTPQIKTSIALDNSSPDKISIIIEDGR